MIPTLEELRHTRLRPIDYHFARTIGTLANESREELLVAAALTSAHLGAGHVCLELESIAGQAANLEDESPRHFPSLAPWLSAIAESPMVSNGEAPTPLVLTGHGRLYLRRYWLHEQFIAKSILARIDEPSAASGEMAGALDALFPAADKHDKQRQAAQLAGQHQFAVVSGGPGTGKTFTVVKILALLVEQAFAANLPAPRMTLVAPTGKAAARLAESIQKAKQALPSSQRVKAAITEEASTIHRALGSIPKSSTRFRHNADNRLLTDLVLVDEASMVNVALMSRLLAAIPEHARLILLGDKDQLASVDAGAVLGDICNTGYIRSKSPQQPRIAPCITHLTKSYRYREGSGIAALATAINEGHADQAIQILRADSHPEVELQKPLPGHHLGATLQVQIMKGYHSLREATAPKQALHSLGEFRVLCAHQNGHASVKTVNREVRNHLETLGRVPPSSEYYHGQPIMIRVNDYDQRLYNGDVGVVLNTAEGLRVFFEVPGAPPRALTPARLPSHSPVYAMSIHKSQGSEFSDIAVVMPPEASPVLTRELLYTAITRAKKSLCIYADADLLKVCITTQAHRSSGLRDLLWQ